MMSLMAEVTEEVTEAAGGLSQLGHMDKEVVLTSLDYLWQGLLSVFIVIFVVFLVVVILNLISAQSAKYKQAHAGEPTYAEKLKEKMANRASAREDKKAQRLLEKEAKRIKKERQEQKNYKKQEKQENSQDGENSKD